MGPLSLSDIGVGSAAFTITNTSQGVPCLGQIVFTPIDNNSLRFLLVGGQGEGAAVQGALASSTFAPHGHAADAAKCVRDAAGSPVAVGLRDEA